MSEKKIVTVLVIVAVAAAAIILEDCGGDIRKVQSGAHDHVLLIDPGHGGMDGGAVSGDGTTEKNINLAIAFKLKKTAEDYGWQVVMTRETDEWLCSKAEGSIRAQKTADLKNRREMIRKYAPDIVVSIHLNSFKEDPSVRGAQVFYPEAGCPEQIVELSREFAEKVQRNLPSEESGGKKRIAMAKGGVMIFREVNCPIILVECGFLSNPDETELLKTKRYQQETARGIMAGITEFTGVQKKKDIELIDSFDKRTDVV